MKTNLSFFSFLPIRIAVLLALAAFFAPVSSWADEQSWKGNGTSTAWTLGTNWVSGTAPSNSTTTDTALFNQTSYSFQPNYGTTSIAGITVGNGTTNTAALTLTGTTLTLGSSGITINPNSGNVTLNSAVKLDGNQIWSNNSSSLFTVGATITNNSSASPVRLTIDGTGNTTISGVISNNTGTGQTSLTKIGAGTLTLSGANTYSGGLNVQSGTLRVSNLTATGTGLVTIGSTGNSATLDLIGGSRTIVYLTTAGTAANQKITNSGGTAATLSLTGVGASNFGGVIENGSGGSTTAVTLNAAGGILTLSGANTYTGATTITSGTLVGIGANAFGSTSGIFISPNMVLSLRGDSSTSFKKASDNSTYSVTLISGNTATINVDQATTAGTSAKTMTIGNINTTSVSNSWVYTFSGANNSSLTVGTITGAAATANGTNTITNSNTTGTLTIGGYTSANTGNSTVVDTLTFTGAGNTTIGAITPAGNSTLALTNSSTGTLTLSGNYNYTGLTTIGTGVSTAVGTTIFGGINNTSGNTTINGSSAYSQNGGTGATVVQLNSASNGGLASGLLTLTNGRIEALGAGRTLSNNVTFTAGAFQGSQDITITGTFTGATGGDRALGNTLASGKKLTLGAVNITNDVSATARTLTIGGTGDTVITGVVANGAGTGVNKLTIWGGNVTLTKANTYTGATTISAGTLLLDFSASGAPASHIINSGNSLVMSGGGLNLKGAGGSATNNQSVVMTNAAGLSRIVVDNNGSTGTTTLALTSTGLGTRTAGATMNIDLSQGLGGNPAGSAITTTATAATLGWATVKDAAGTGFAKYSGTNVVRLTGQTTLVNSSNASATDFITAPTSASTTGSPYLSLSVTPSYNTLTVDTSGATGANFLDLNGKTVTLTQKAVLMTGSNDFTIQGTGQLGAAGSEVIVQQMGSGNLTINSAIGSAGATLTKSGSGTLTLGGTQSYTGVTTVNQGTLVLNADISTAGAMTINEGTVRLGASDRISNSNVMTIKSGGTLDLNGFNETITSLALHAGATISGGNNSTLTLSAATPIQISSGVGTGVTSVINSNLNFTAATATLDLRQNSYGAPTTLEINGAISGAATSFLGSGSNSGAATLRLSGTTSNTFTGTFGVVFNTNGLVEFNKTDGVDAIGAGGISLISPSNVITYKWLASNQINDSASIVMDGGLLNLNGFNETVASLTSGFTANFIPSSGGTLTLAGTTGNVLSLTNNGSNVSKTLDMNLALSGSGGNISFTSNATTNRSIQIGGATPGTRTLDLGSVVRTIDVADGGVAVDALITSRITGTGGINKTSAGVLQLSAANTFSGDTKVTAGTLTISNDLALQNSALDTSGAGVITLTGVIMPTFGGLKGSTNLASVITTGYGTISSITLNPGTGVTNTYSGNITDGAVTALIKTGNGTQVLSGINTYSGTTTISAGTLQIGNGGSTGSLSTSSSIINNAALTFNRSDTMTQGTDFANSISGSGNLTQAGSGTLALGGTNTFTGLTTLSAGNISISTSTALGSTSGINLGNATALIYTGVAGNLTRDIAVTSGTGTIRNSGSGLLTLSGALSKNGTTLTLAGGSNGITVSGAIGGSSANSDLVIDGGTVNLTGTNTYNGPTSLVNGATLNANAVGALPTANGRSAVSIDATGTGSSTLVLGTNQSIASLAGAATSNVTLGSNTLTVGTTSGSTTYAGRITGSGALVKDGASTQVLSGTNTYTGGTTINGGNLTVTGGSALADTGIVTLSNTSGAILSVSTSETIGSLSGGGASGGNVVIASAQTLTLNQTTNTTFSGAISGANLVKNGSGTLTVNGSNTYTGTTTVNSGTLAAASANALASTSEIIVNNGGSFLVTADDAVNDNADVTLAGGTLAVNGTFNESVGLLTLSANSVIDLNSYNGTLRFSGVSASWAPTANLSIWNWNGINRYNTPVGDGANNRHVVFTDATGLDSYLSRISFYSDNGTSFAGNAFEVSGFSGGGTEIIAVPETETYFYAVALLAGVVVQYIRRRAKRKPLGASSSRMTQISSTEGASRQNRQNDTKS